MDAEKAKSIKPPKSYREQVEILKSRNLIVENQEYAESILSRVNYYRLSAYALTMKDAFNSDQFADDMSFEKLLSQYEFDRKLRLLLLGVLETIEIAFRSHLAYEIAHKYGPLGYQDKEIFINEKYHQEFLNELRQSLIKSRKGELFVEHHYKNYSGNFPIWVAIEVTSFGTLSKLFKNVNDDLKKHIAKVYYNVPFNYIESWLQCLSYVRNVCAHYGRLYNKQLTFKPRLFREEKAQFGNNKLFSAIHIMQRLITIEDGNRFIINLEALISKYEEYIDFFHIGFPENWTELLTNIQTKKIQ